jgi:hypothetical protein
MNRADELAAEYLIRQVPEEPLQPAPETTAERLAKDYDQYCAKRDAEPLPRFLNSPRLEDGPDRVSPLEAVAGFAVVAIVIFIFGWVL